ncbi:periplasmic beta-glucosidase [Escherichia coli]|uniref:Periplasmic beta-glucosidase n=1 Tax=Escherichia coli TaxID=562 RepID=A0A2X1N693_ECOLX|nr:periplasmic beta-glucosidase [Escherichia coli]
MDTNAESRLHRKEAREVARESLVLLKNRLENVTAEKNRPPLRWLGHWRTVNRDVMGSWSAAGVADHP